MNMLEADKPKKMKSPSAFKRFINKIRLGAKVIPRQQLVGGIISALFFLFGLGHFIYYVAVFFKANPSIGYFFLYAFLAFITFNMIRSLIKKVRTFYYQRKIKIMQKKNADSEQSDTPKNIL